MHTDKGLAPIQDIKVGDIVLSHPENGGSADASTEYKRVKTGILFRSTSDLSSAVY